MKIKYRNITPSAALRRYWVPFTTIAHAERIVVDEFNSVNDNPVVDHENHNIFHGGNFHGDYISLEMDKLKTTITKLSMLSERQLNYLLNNKAQPEVTVL